MDDIENEEHFLNICTTYKDIREDFIQDLEKDDTLLDILKTLFGASKFKNIYNINKAIRYIRRAMARRNSILEII